MNANELAKLLNSLTKHNLEWCGSGYMQSQDMVEDKAGEWVGCESLANAMGLEWDWVTGEFSVKDK
jgi:hypothetical protein